MTDLTQTDDENQEHELVKKLRAGFLGPKGYGAPFVNSVKLTADAQSIEFELPVNDSPAYIIRELLKKQIPDNAYQSTREETEKNTYRIAISAIESAPEYQRPSVPASERFNNVPKTHYKSRY